MKGWAVLASSLLWASAASASEPFQSIVRGPFVAGSFGTNPVGDALLFQAGANHTGIRSYDERRWLFAWDLAGSGMFGLLGNQHPFLTVLGVHANASAELGRRIWNDRRWSPWVGGRMAGDLRILEHPGLSVDELDTINDSGAGAIGKGLVRVEAGMSMLDDRRSLLLALFVQEAFQARSVTQPIAAFTQIGLAARFDLARSVMAELDAAWGVTPNRGIPALGASDQTTRAGASGSVRKIFGNGLWLGLALGISRDTDVITYSATKTSYGTGNAPVFDAMLSFGWSPGGPR